VRSPSTSRTCPCGSDWRQRSCFLPNRRRTLLGFRAAFAALLLWWSLIQPSNQRDWQPEGALLPYATQDGERITLHNVRNFDYRTEQDFVARYDERTSICVSSTRST
jgi:hypothetical protein